MRKIRCDYLITNTEPPINDAIILLHTNGTIIDYGAFHLFEGLDDVEYYRGIICPGFINTHCHLELSHLKGAINEGLGLVGFIQELQKIRNKSNEEILEAALVWDEQMYKNGIDMVGDISNSSITSTVKKNSKISYHTFVEVFGFNPAVADTLIEQAKKTASTFTTPVSITAHAPYSVSVNLFKKIQEENKKFFTIHHAESAEEDKFFKTKEGHFVQLYKGFGINIDFFEALGAPSINYYEKYLPVNSNLLFVHTTFSEKYDIERIRALGNRAYVACCANANLYIEGRLPNLLEHQKYLTITIGTDSLASNKNLDILSELISIQQRFKELTTYDLIKMATINGANYFNEKKLGRIFKNKPSSLIHIEKANLQRILEGAIAHRIQ